MSGTLRSFLAELIGTFALVFVGAGSVCLDAATGGRVGPVGVALAHGAALAAMIHAYGPVSGAHFNPAVTLALRLTRRIEGIPTVFYLAAQLLGAALAGLLLKAAFHNFPALASAPPFLGACLPSGVGYKGATLLEAVATFFLVTAVYATSLDARRVPGSAPAAAALACAAGVLSISTLTGAALNPARAFGPAVATGQWSHWYVYWAGPLAGAAAAALIHENLFLKREGSPET